jgi:UDP-N-acetylmuramoyl-L-alanyl-D-glutamate--2,6-diaminopimelate ligase
VSAPGSSAPRDLRPARVEPLALREVAALLGAAADPTVNRQVMGVTHDSRAVRPGDLYAALPGARAHGAAFAAEAAGRGAVAMLTDPAGVALAAGALPAVVVADPRAALGGVAARVYGQPSSRLRCFGVTGTNGKTTTSYLVEAGLRAAGDTTGLIGTIETRIGDDSVASARTTPEASDLQALLATMVERGVGAVAMEVSSHALALNRVDGTRFQVVAFTNLSQDHLDFHADLDDYFAAKARLFTPPFASVGVVNSDDEHGRRLLAAPQIDLLGFSLAGDPSARWRASDLVADAGGSRFTAHGPDVRVAVSTVLPGRFNAANALAALAMLVVAGVDPGVAARGIAGLAGVPGRLERVDAGQPFTALVDFAHTPEAVGAMLATVREMTSGRVLVVLGCGGDRDAAKRPLMGAAAARLADVAVLTSDNPRSEDPQVILDSVVAGARSVPTEQQGEVVVQIDRAAAIGLAVSRARPGDVVVVAGKGHEQGQEVAGVVHPFDDRTALRAQLAAHGFAGEIA